MIRKPKTKRPLENIIENFNSKLFVFAKKLDSLTNFRKYIFLYLVVIAIFLFLFAKFGFFEIFSYGKINVYYLLLFFVLSIVQLFVLSLRYSLYNEKKYSLKQIYYYLCGLAVTLGIPPKPLGEAFRVIILKYYYKIQYSQVIFSIAMENVFDIITVLTIGLISSVLLPFPSIMDRIVLIVLAILLSVVSVIICYYFIKVFNIKIKFFDSVVFNFLKNILSLFYKEIKKMEMISFKTISLSLFLSVLKIFICTLRIYLVFLMFGVEVNFFIVLGLWSLCEIIGNVSMLPGGLGAYELSFVYLSSVLGIDSTLALSVVIIDRLFSFWLYLVVGFGIIILSKKPVEEMRKEFIKYLSKQMQHLFSLYLKTHSKTKEFAEKIKADLKETTDLLAFKKLPKFKKKKKV
ncbi:MAG: lysylphosphatidylglycerol synthase transmembrane domain-containing protein [Candidatus ainarchaeum sp.]|nr:lysylphosphatidylglycerol synthase transmembrane domain-containing protein [Candidatus ainarchaeum sp.]